MNDVTQRGDSAPVEIYTDAAAADDTAAASAAVDMSDFPRLSTA